MLHQWAWAAIKITQYMCHQICLSFFIGHATFFQTKCKCNNQFFWVSGLWTSIWCFCRSLFVYVSIALDPYMNDRMHKRCSQLRTTILSVIFLFFYLLMWANVARWLFPWTLRIIEFVYKFHSSSGFPPLTIIAEISRGKNVFRAFRVSLRMIKKFE